AATPTGRGYWLASAGGAVKAFGDAVGSAGLTSAPNLPIVGLATSQSGKGYWLTAADGAVSAFGDAVSVGSV
ncbi:MAG TPA: hypothetical protein VGP90_05080, partial [Acidimicrobiia bacterium]|nr:hypothetical protein [Acidimicrobiia bacterium]